MHFIKQLGVLTETGVTTALDLQGLFQTLPSTHVLQAVTTGSPTVTGTLQGSLDGVTYFNLATAVDLASNALIFFVDKPVRYVKGSITLADGTAPTVTLTYLGVA